MKKTLFLAALALLAASAFAFPRWDEPGYFPAELKAIQADFGTKTLGSLTAAELIPVAERLDVARQKDRFVMMAGGLSMVWPGAGQFADGDWGTGSLHTGLHLGITAASLAWAHSLLPADLQFDRLNYFASSRDAIENAWKSHVLNDFWPSIGALAAGGAVDFALRFWSFKDAQATAKAKIDSGAITFEPRFDEGRLGFGMRW